MAGVLDLLDRELRHAGRRQPVAVVGEVPSLALSAQVQRGVDTVPPSARLSSASRLSARYSSKPWVSATGSRKLGDVPGAVGRWQRGRVSTHRRRPRTGYPPWRDVMWTIGALPSSEGRHDRRRENGMDDADAPGRSFPMPEPGDLVGHWRSEDFHEEALSWARMALAHLGYRAGGPLKEHRIRFWSALFTVTTDRGTVWFKATNPGQLFEAGLLATLAELVAGDVLAPLAVDAERGWLLLPDGGQTLRDRGNVTPAEWEALVVRAARMQMSLAPHEHRLLEAGLPVLLPSDAVEYVTSLVEELTALPRGHRQRLDATTARDLHSRLRAVTHMFADLAAADVPMTLQPNDVSPGNAFVARHAASRLRLFDLGDAFWSHPLAVLQVPVRLATGAWPEPPPPGHPLAARIRRAYVAQWASGLPPGDGADLDRLLDAADRLASLHRCESWRRLLAHVDADHLGVPTPLLATWLAETVRPTRGP